MTTGFELRSRDKNQVTGTLVSVVIPTYNRAHLICDALNSVVAQTYRPIEIVVVDDGSTDATADVIDEWLERPGNDTVMLRFVAQEKRGKNPTRNRGILESTGDLIGFLDSDDRYRPSKVEKQVARFSDPQVGAVYCGIANVDMTTGEAETLAHAYPEGHLFKRLLIKDITNPTSTYMVRRSVLDRVGLFDEAISGRTDWEMALRIARDNVIAAVPEPLVEFRAHGGARTATFPEREIAGFRHIRRKYADDIASLPVRARMAARAAYYRRMGRVNLHGNLSRPSAFGYYVAALACAPTEFDNWAAFTGFFLPATLRRAVNLHWNRVFGGSRWAIRSH
jgi:glycosyltransferase involved in cell wall biosynthesis